MRHHYVFSSSSAKGELARFFCNFDESKKWGHSNTILLCSTNIQNIVFQSSVQSIFKKKKSPWIFPQIFRRFPVAPLIPYPLITKVRLHCRLWQWLCLLLVARFVTLVHLIFFFFFHSLTSDCQVWYCRRTLFISCKTGWKLLTFSFSLVLLCLYRWLLMLLLLSPLFFRRI